MLSVHSGTDMEESELLYARFKAGIKQNKPFKPSDHSGTHHHELASTTSSWELQARKAAASSRCRTAPGRLLRTGLLSMVRRVSATQPVLLGKVLRCWDMERVLLSPDVSPTHVCVLSFAPTFSKSSRLSHCPLVSFQPLILKTLRQNCH